MTPAPTTRASLLAGLRTGGVRSTSGPLSNVPHSATVSGSFTVPRYASQHASSLVVEEEDEVNDMQSYNHLYHNGALPRPMPMTAAVDGPGFAHQQKGLNPNSVPFSPSFGGSAHQLQALQMQVMQLELLKLQAMQQAHQYQTEIMAQAQRQQQPQVRRASLGFNAPASAGPANGTFDLRSATQPRRPNQAEFLKSQLGISGGDAQVPMTAALGGRFGSRTASANLARLANFAVDENEEWTATSSATNSTTVISGGTSLGGSAMSANVVNPPGTPSKSDSAVSWRRGGNNNSVLSGNNRAVTSPRVKVTPPPEDRVSPPSAERNSPSPPATVAKSRPVPLRFSSAAAQMPPVVAVNTSPLDSGEAINSTSADDGYSSASSKSASSPTTPRSASSNEHLPLSPREEASKKLYEGLGIGRPVLTVVESQTPPPVAVISHRMVSQPMRQPRGPPSGTDELAPHNFASRLRRKAIGGLGAALMSARERREVVEAY